MRNRFASDDTLHGIRCTILQRASHVVLALSDALWKRQTSPKQHRYHYEARRTWDTLGNAPKVKVPTLILCGADDDVDLGGRTPVRTAR
jgi:pimeloyl-ACP methyl ester carboxylesterase